MTTSLCPIATVNAPVERAWSLLADPAGYAAWWDAHTRAVLPPGPARPGQRVEADSRALGRSWDVTVIVQAVDEARHNLKLTTRLPLGITVYNSITCTPLDPSTCRVSFG
jgi:uncharacterized protein YndB with AHSA1/START domain